MSNKPTLKDRGAMRALVSRRRFLAVTAGVSAVVGAGGGFSLSARADTGLVALVHTQAAGDSGPIDSMMGRLQQLSEAEGFETRAIYAQDPATYETVLRILGDAGASIVLGTFPVISEAFKAVAPLYPDTKWIQLFGDAVDPPIANLVTISYDYYLGCYLSGIFAAHVSQSKQIGYIGGISIPPLNADFNALQAGVHAVNPEATVTAAFAGSFQDPAKGYEIASQMFLDGIDYIQTDSAATDGGIIQAANEREGAMVSALDPAQYPPGSRLGDRGREPGLRPVAPQRGERRARRGLAGRPARADRPRQRGDRLPLVAALSGAGTGGYRRTVGRCVAACRGGARGHPRRIGRGAVQHGTLILAIGRKPSRNT